MYIVYKEQSVWEVFMEKISINAMAKINLGLDVLRKREDGYHEVKMIMQSIDLYDRIEMIKTEAPGIEVSTNLKFLPVNEDNLVYKAVKLLFDAYELQGGISINLKKYIPVAAGLAGGSSDAAAVLYGINRMYELKLSLQELMDWGVKIGADVPFCLCGGTMLAQGVGEVLTPLTPMPECSIVLCKPGYGMSTAKVFGSLKIDEIQRHPDTDSVISALNAGDISRIAGNMYNVLEEIVAKEKTDISRIEEEMLSCGALGAIMSGSGSTTFGVFDDEEKAKLAYNKLKAKYKETYIAKT